MTGFWLLTLTLAMVGALIGLVVRLSRRSGADSAALANADAATKRAEAINTATVETVERVEDATLAITDRAAALDFLRARHPK